jgi:hypothetical protein
MQVILQFRDHSGFEPLLRRDNAMRIQVAKGHHHFMIGLSLSGGLCCRNGVRGHTPRQQQRSNLHNEPVLAPRRETIHVSIIAIVRRAAVCLHLTRRQLMAGSHLTVPKSPPVAGHESFLRLHAANRHNQ